MNDKPVRELYDSIEHGEWLEVKDFSRIRLSLEKAASETSTKDYRINVRITGNHEESRR